MIRSAEEQKMYANEMNIKNVENAWIGLNDIIAEGLFVTVLNEKLSDIGYENWTDIYGVREPSNGNGQNQDCVDIVKQGGGMDDNWCESKIPYFCKICKTNEFTKDCNPGNFSSNTETELKKVLFLSKQF